MTGAVARIDHSRQRLAVSETSVLELEDRLAMKAPIDAPVNLPGFNAMRLSTPIKISHLDGRSIGQAFLECVIGDPKVQAVGEQLCEKCPILVPLFKEGKFPVGITPNRQTASRNRQEYANVGYSELKAQWGWGPRRTPSNANQSVVTPAAWRQSVSVDWDYKWPLRLEAEDLVRIFNAVSGIVAIRRNDPLKNLIDKAAEALSECHQTFFNRFCAGDLVGQGIFTGSRQELPLSGKEWDRTDRYLDIESSDLLKRDGKNVAAIWESVTLRIPKQGKEPKTRRPRPADQALEQELKKLGLADGRHGKTDYEIACDLIGRRGLAGKSLDQVVDRKRKQVKRFYERRGLR